MNYILKSLGLKLLILVPMYFTYFNPISIFSDIFYVLTVIFALIYTVGAIGCYHMDTGDLEDTAKRILDKNGSVGVHPVTRVVEMTVTTVFSLIIIYFGDIFLGLWYLLSYYFAWYLVNNMVEDYFKSNLIH